MRRIVEALRCDFVISGRPAWGYGLICALGICLPLLVGVLSGRIHEGAAMALGGYLAVFGDAPGLPYGARARKLLLATAVVTLGVGLGGLIQFHPWPAVVVVGLVVAAGTYWSVLGIPAMLAVVLAYFAPSALSPPFHMAITAAGGLLVTLLVVVVWPVRRLQPLNRAMRSAGTAVADLLASEGRASLSEESRELLQRNALTAQKAAARALSLYRVSDEDNRSPERLLVTLTRILHETIALRVLRAAAVQAGIGASWTEELEEAVEALALALREAVTSGSSASVPEALAAARRFADRTEEILEAVDTGGTPLTGAVLLGQIRRGVDRTGMAVRSVAQQTAEGLDVRLRLPRFGLPGRPVFAPGHDPVRRGLATIVAMGLMVLVHEHYAKWFVVTVVVSLRPAYRDTVDRVLLRVLGTAVGAMGAALVLAIAPGLPPLILFIGICAALGFAFRGSCYGYWAMFSTPLSLMLSDFSLPLDWSAAVARVALTIAGGALALLFARLLWPRENRAQLTGRIADMIEKHAALVRSLVDQDSGGVRAEVASAADAEERLAESLDRLDKEPGGSAPQRLRDAVTAAQRLRDNVLALLAVPPPGEKAGPTVTILDMVADRLERVAEAVRTERPEEPPDDLDGILNELGAYVDGLAARRMDERAEGAEGAADRMTGVHEGIRHAAAAQSPLRGLSAEAVRLASLSAPRR
ncbi:FUSC family protein [Streptosporangium lutulentum]|uniref:Membrane protein YccC n=1 Tax=Streptosporangium lutulentum TaxID=1461250 RepID=A0ABT9QKS6_9ACTN|nr:FUSC family protein [Streptosporangium lutulentum]MDP9847362.1 putative membrane protein YccC [Streptosporangium lutulentum]